MSSPPTHHVRMPLVPAEAVRDITGLRRDEIYDRVDGASLLHRAFVWVWNFSATFPDHATRDLRFWRAEIEGEADADGARHGRFNGYELPWVIDKVLPKSRANFHSGEVIQMFALSRPALARLRDDLNGERAGARNVMFTRAHLAAFLERRWLGAVYSRKAKSGKAESGNLSTPCPRRQMPDPKPDLTLP